MTKKRASPSTVEELFALPKRDFEKAMREAFRHLVAIGALINGGCSENGEVRWLPVKTHPYWAQVWDELEGERSNAIHNDELGTEDDYRS
jgi:hypothetical protein